MKYEPTKRSIKQHEVPDWFNDAKFEIYPLIIYIFIKKEIEIDSSLF